MHTSVRRGVWACLSALLLALPGLASAAVVGIEKLSVEKATVSLDYGLDTISDSGAVEPPAVIQMGTFQDPIWTYQPAGTIEAKVYSTGVPGEEPNGTVDTVAGTLDVDLSSLRGSIDLGDATLDFALWPITTPATSSSYDPLSQSFTLSWSGTVEYDLTTVLFGNETTTSGTATLDLTLGGTVTPVPAPAAVWLFGAGLAGIASLVRRRRVPAAA